MLDSLGGSLVDSFEWSRFYGPDEPSAVWHQDLDTPLGGGLVFGGGGRGGLRPEAVLLREQLHDAFVTAVQSQPFERQLGWRELVRAQEICFVGGQTVTDQRHRRFIRFDPLIERGVARSNGEHVVLVELVARDVEMPVAMGLPTSTPLVSTRSVSSRMGPEQIEPLKYPVGLVVSIDPVAGEVKGVQLLASGGAFVQMLVHLSRLNAEIDIWTAQGKGLPFVAPAHLIERSALLGATLDAISRPDRQVGAREGALLIEQDPVLVIGITECTVRETGSTRLRVLVGRGQGEGVVLEPSQMSFFEMTWDVSFTRDKSGVVEVKERIVDSTKKRLTDESLRRAEHLYLLAYRRLISHFGFRYSQVKYHFPAA